MSALRRKRDPSRRRGRPRRRAPKPPPPDSAFDPRVNSKLAPVLGQIGSPESSPFVPDPFQVEAVSELAHRDVVVSAPTGSGKTWIAEQAIRAALDAGQRAWYASPLKALSNSKYAEFGELFGADKVGILTGERKENTAAPLVVGTTEILRNQLYDSMYRGQDLDSGLVVLDEAHFLGDPDRGVVWEEVIIYLPVRVRLLLLSATVQNAGQISRWLEFVRDRPCTTVVSFDRPVPLYPAFLFPDGELTPLRGSKGLFPKVRQFVETEGGKRPSGPWGQMPPFGNIMRALETADLLPAIFFLKSRSDCDNALAMAASAQLTLDPESNQALRAEVDGFVQRYPFVASHPHLPYLQNLQVAAHHAGHLPHWKLMVERLMQRGLLKAIFSTSTVAAGVNFPARTVVVTQSDRFNGREFVDLSATDLLQMTGRAGRRGMDKIGFCVVVPGQFNNVPLVAGLLASDPEPIWSQLSINFSMVLNLLLSHRPAEVKQLLGMSLATFQRLESVRAKSKPEGGPQRVLQPLHQALKGSHCPGPEEAVIRRRRRRQLRNLRARLDKKLETTQHHGLMWAALTRGRVFTDIFGSPAAVIRRDDQENEPGVLAVSLNPDKRLLRGRPRLDFVPLGEIAGVCQEKLRLPQTGGGRALAQAVINQIPEHMTPLSSPELEALAQVEQDRAQERLALVDQEMAELPCGDCPLSSQCHDPNGTLRNLMDKAEGVLNLIQEESHAFWFDFVRHLEFLRSEGYVDSEGHLTPDGLWASKLRLDQPVLIAEAIRTSALPQQDPVLLAALVALFVDDRERDTDSPYLSQRLQDGFNRLRGALDPVLDRLRQWRFSTPPLPLTAAAAVFAWGLMGEFEDVAAIYGGGEGDLAQLIYRCADNLRQIISLEETHPDLARTAREAVELLLRPPAVVPT